MSVAEHLERYLGPIAEGWSLRDSDTGIQVVRFDDKPDPGVSTLSTLGLSRHTLGMPRDRTVRQEILMVIRSEADLEAAAAALLSLAMPLAATHRAFLRGEVVGPGNPVIEGSPMNAFYATRPTVFPDGLATYEGSEPPTVVVWMIPIHSKEAAFARVNGWSDFEDRLEALQPDLFNLQRHALPLRES
jgi:hypothetical protein